MRDGVEVQKKSDHSNIDKEVTEYLAKLSRIHNVECNWVPKNDFELEFYRELGELAHLRAKIEKLKGDESKGSLRTTSYCTRRIYELKYLLPPFDTIDRSTSPPCISLF